MKINLSKFLEEDRVSFNVKGEYIYNTILFEGRKIKFKEPLNFSGNIYKVGEDNFIYLNIEFAYIENCGRCLTSFQSKSSITLDSQIKSINYLEEEDEDMLYYDEHENLDLKEAIESLIILNLPMKPICKDECKGLCPICGINKNDNNCDCVIENIDPRLAKLKDFCIED